MKYVIEGTGKKIYELDVARLEKKLRLKLPGEYREFLKKHNGGRPIPKFFRIPRVVGGSEISVGQVLDFFGIDDPIDSCRLDWTYEVFAKQMPNGFFPVACEDGGNILCISLRAENFGAVYYWTHDKPMSSSSDNLVKISETFEEFLANLFLEE